MSKLRSAEEIRFIQPKCIVLYCIVLYCIVLLTDIILLFCNPMHFRFAKSHDRKDIKVEVKQEVNDMPVPPVKKFKLSLDSRSSGYLYFKFLYSLF